ncbi:hypothetical protein M0805_000722 [Coniferiporia weirii]|nr:hypothetical protein M0805_000722 [Coniferiporia weirii]
MSSATGILALDNTMGALFLGVIFSMALWGAGTVQMYYYYNTYHAKDEIWIKLLVFVVWVLDTAHQGLITQSCYVYLVTQYGNAEYLAVLERSLMVMVIVTAAICFIVQTFFTVRIWRLSQKNIFITAFVFVFVLAQLISTLVYFGTAIHFTQFVQLLGIRNLTRSINVVNAMADAAIAGALVFLLQNSRTGFRHSESVINRLILFTVNTGLLTGMTAVVCLAMNLAFPTTFLYILFYLMTSRLYMNSLLATLNSRKSVQSSFGDSIQSVHVSQGISMDRFRTQPLESSNSYGGDGKKVVIRVETGVTSDNRTESDLENCTPNVSSDAKYKVDSYAAI